jgi:signal transduction histidine kinase
MGHIDLALSNGLSDAFRNENLEGLAIAKASGSLLLSIIQDILDLSKIEAGQLVVENDEPFLVSEALAQTTSLAKTLIKSKQKHIGFTCFIEQGIQPCIKGDAFRLQQVSHL